MLWHAAHVFVIVVTKVIMLLLQL